MTKNLVQKMQKTLWLQSVIKSKYNYILTTAAVQLLCTQFKEKKQLSSLHAKSHLALDG